MKKSARLNSLLALSMMTMMEYEYQNVNGPFPTRKRESTHPYIPSQKTQEELKRKAQEKRERKAKKFLINQSPKGLTGKEAESGRT